MKHHGYYAAPAPFALDSYVDLRPVRVLATWCGSCVPWVLLHSSASCYFHKTGLTSFYFIFQLDVTNKRIIHMEEGLRVFIKVQLGLFSALIVLFAVVMYFAIHPM